MKLKFDVAKIVECGSCPKELTISEYMKSIYEKIGQHIVNDAENLAKGVGENAARAEMKIVIEPNSVVTLENKINYYIMEE